MGKLRLYEGKEELFKEECVPDPRDAKTPDAWVARHPEMVRLTGIHPFNSESPLDKLKQAGFITPSSIHYTRNHGAVPRLSWETHRIEMVADESDVAKGFKPRSLSMDDLTSLRKVEVACTMTCAGNRRKEENLTKKTVGFSWNTTATSTAVWGGVRLRDVLLKLCNLPWDQDEDDFGDELEERYVWMVGADELPKGKYGTCIPLGLAMNVANDVILAYEVNGEILPPDRGFPVRVVIPGWIGGRMVKWLERIEIRKGESTNHYHYFDNRILPPLITKEIADDQGWWMKSEYLFNELNINSAIWEPAHDDTVIVSDTSLEAEHVLKGYAYSGGGRRVTRVEISFDVGRTWSLCELQVTERPNRYGMYWCWVHWSYKASVEELMTPHQWIHCRAWDESSNTQPNRLTWNVMGMGNNCIFGVRVDHTISINGATELRFVHPTQEAGMSVVGWMQADHQLPAPAPPIRMPKPHSSAALSTLSSYADENTDFYDSEIASEAFSEDAAVDGVDLRYLNSYTLDEVAIHDSEESAWIVVRDKVYDCTPFLKEHPGGASSILMVAGTDTTEDFVDIHSPKALKMLQDYLIGVITFKSGDSSDSNSVSPPASLHGGNSASDAGEMENPTSSLGAAAGAWLQPRSWVDFEITLKEQLSSDMILVRFAPQDRDSMQQRPLGLPVGKHVLIKADELNSLGKPEGAGVVVRPYTPIVLESRREEKYEFTLVVKVYRANQHPKFPLGGKMSQVLDALPVGSVIKVKGPCGHVEYAGKGKILIGKRVEMVRNIGFMCGGTGITPAFRIIEAALGDTDDTTVFHLLYANNSVEAIALHDEIDSLAVKHPQRLKVYYTVSNPPTDRPWQFGIGFISPEMTRKVMPDPHQGGVFVGLCGPPAMIEKACIPSLKAMGYCEEQYECF